MFAAFRSLIEAVVEKGVRGLVQDFVPGGRYVCDVAERFIDKEKARRSRDQLRAEFERIAVATREDALAQAVVLVAEVAREKGVGLPQAEAAVVAEWVAGVPDAVRVSSRRSDDWTGRTLALDFALDTPDDVLKVLPPRPPRFLAGAKVPGIEDWTLDRILGVGGFGEVWLATHDGCHDPPMAVKFFFDQTGRDVIREADLVRRVTEAMTSLDAAGHIVRILRTRLRGDAPWLGFEYVSGGNLATWLFQLAARPVAERVPQVVAALRQLCRGAGLFHGLPTPIAHRDLKPSNILLDKESQRLKITDFGIGAVTQREANARDSRGKTTKGERLVSYLHGAHTPTYSSPQQRRGEPPDPRDDVHALGVIGYQLLVGRLDQGPGPGAVKQLKRLGVPDALADLLADCASEELADRPADARVFGARLHTLGRMTAVVPAIVQTPAVPLAPVGRGLRAEDERRVAIPGGVEMVFCWVPTGTCQLGSPQSERNAVATQFGNCEDWLAAESEVRRGVYSSPGFWLGKYPVTQAEWHAVTGDRPSHFQAGAGGAAQVKGLDTTRFPVENVSWNMCQDFLKQLNAKAPGGAFRLPHEDEWEYAARGGMGNKQAFYWGAELNGTQANHNGNCPFGMDTKGKFLRRPCPVEFSNGGKYPAHPWGLAHLLGNIWEWCENTYEQTAARVLRGGSWHDDGFYCRAAVRTWLAANYQDEIAGCRLVLA